MPTDLAQATGRFAGMTPEQVIEEQERLLEQWRKEDAARRARFAAIMGGVL